jgi:uncharacterized coiled-coil DUF342 family protein
MPEDAWSAGLLKEMHDRDIRALRDLLTAEIRRLDDGARQAQKALDLVAEERGRAQDKFEATVAARFVQQNEFRDSLDDLGKEMATRRELEASVKALRDERNALMDSINKGIEANGKQIAELRESRSQTVGEHRRGQEISASLLAWLGVSVILASALIGLLVKFA